MLRVRSTGSRFSILNCGECVMQNGTIVDVATAALIFLQ